MKNRELDTGMSGSIKWKKWNVRQNNEKQDLTGMSGSRAIWKSDLDRGMSSDKKQNNRKSGLDTEMSGRRTKGKGD